MNPQTLAQWLAELRRKDVRCRLHGERVHVTGLKKLTKAERDALFASAPQVQALLVARAERRRAKEKKEQQQSKATAQQPRRVIGQVVNPGRPLRLLFADEVKEIRPTQRARVLMAIPYGWRR